MKRRGRDVLSPLRRVMEGNAWVALDTEATGLGPGAALVEVAIASPDGSLFESLVRPEAPMTAGAMALHGITSAESERAPPFGELAVEVRRRIARKTVLVYHVDFDRPLLWRAFARAGQPAPKCRWLCLCDLLTRWSGRRHHLDGALRALGVEGVRAAHRAGPDARALVGLAKALAESPVQDQR